MKRIRRISVVILTLLVCFIFVPVAFAHPLGNFTINQYAGLQISADAADLDYVLDMAEIPAFQEIAAFDTNGNGQADAGEATGYPVAKCALLQPDLQLLLNNQPITFTLATSSVDFPAGVGGLSTLRLTCGFHAAVDLSESNITLTFNNNAFSERLGWKEIVVVPNGVALQGEFATASVSNRLTKYPQDLLTSPLEQRQVSFKITSTALPTQNQAANSAEQAKSTLADRNDAFTRLILLDEVTFPTLLLALGISFIWGAMHALTPGHGKTIVGAYLVGSRGTMKHAVYLGLTTTITHTLGVFALGFITLFAARFIVPEKLYPWMTLLSGLFVVGIGLNLLVNRFKSSGLRILLPKGDLVRREYAPVFEHSHTEANSHSHKFVLNSSRAEFHTHDDAHSHSHSHEHGDLHDHTHTAHSHLPPGADGSPVTWRSLLALGVSGGLIPCPSALIVLLGAIALNRIGFGLVLVLAFSLGLAGALTAIGMMFIYAGRLFNRFPSQAKVIRFLPVLSALFVSAIGVAISVKALAEIGIIG